MSFALADLPRTRDLAADCARGYGMPDDRVGDVLVAVNEVATNAVTHGAERARIRLWLSRGHLMVEVFDEGHWKLDEAEPGGVAPDHHATSGMGLWVARRLSSRITFTTGTDGTSVTMAFKV